MGCQEMTGHYWSVLMDERSIDMCAHHWPLLCLKSVLDDRRKCSRRLELAEVTELALVKKVDVGSEA